MKTGEVPCEQAALEGSAKGSAIQRFLNEVILPKLDDAPEAIDFQNLLEQYRLENPDQESFSLDDVLSYIYDCVIAQFEPGDENPVLLSRAFFLLLRRTSK